MAVMVTADVIVVGLGAVGSAALYQAAKLGAAVIGIDRFTPPHEQGSSHGETRITRQAIGEGREFVPLVLRSNEIWNELEADSGRSLLTRNGCLVLAVPTMQDSHHGSQSFLGDTVDVARGFGIAHEVLGPDDLRQRFPQFHLQSGESAYFEPGGGFLRPELCVQTQIELACGMGARLLTNEVVLEVHPASNRVEVKTNRGEYEAGRVILTVGPWISGFLPPESHEHFLVYRQTLCWFTIARNFERYVPKCFPVFIWLTGGGVHEMLYGFPAIDGPWGGMKIATERYEETVDPDHVPREVARELVTGMYLDSIAPRFPDLGSDCLRAATCLYTVTPDAKFVIDQADENVIFASACSGHGFKHSPAVGEALVHRVLGLSSTLDLSPFDWKRLRKARA